MRKVALSLSIFLVFALLASPVLAGEPIKIGYIDFQKAVSASEAGKDAKAIIAKNIEESQKLLAEKQDELEKLEEELKKQGLLLKEDVRKKKEQDYQIKLRDFQIYYKGAQEKLKEEDKKLTQPIIKELEKIAAEIGERKGYTLILMKSLGIIYTTRSIDITDEAIKIYNKRYKEEKNSKK